MTALAILAMALEVQGESPELGPPRDVAFTAEIDGSEQRYVERLPPGFNPDKTVHLLVALHGHGADRWQYATGNIGSMPAARAVAAGHGMIFVSPDYRAKTSWMGPAAEADLIQIIRALTSSYRIDKVFLVGGSMGGSSVLTFTALHPDMVAGIVSCNGTANHLEYEHFQDAIRESFGGEKRDIPLEYKKRSAEYFPEAFTMPVAICAGGKDTSVPPHSVLRLAAVVKKLNPDVLLLYREDGGHSTTTEDAVQALEFVISRALGGPHPRGPHGVAKGGIFCRDVLPESTDAAGTVELGLDFVVTAPGNLTQFRFYQAAGETGAHDLRLWSSDAKLVLKATVPECVGEGWYAVPLPHPLAVRAGEKFVLSYTASSHYPATAGFFAKPLSRNGITARRGVYSFEPLAIMPTKTYKQMNYFVDVDYERDQPGD